MRFKLFGHYWHLGLAMTWAAESAVIFGCSWLAYQLIGAPVQEPMAIWVQSFVLGAFVFLSMISMGLLSRRLRDRMAGIALRVILSVAAGSDFGAMLPGLMPGDPPAPVQEPMAIWVQSFVLGAFVFLSMISMGLLSRRLRDRMAGIALRVILSVAAGSILGAMLLGLMPEYRPSLIQVGLFALISCAL